MTKYIKKEIADLNGKGTTQAYYRIKAFRRLDSEEFLERCSKHSGMPRGALLGALADVAHELAFQIANGYTVQIDGIGTFGGKLGVRRDKEQDTFEEGTQKRNAKSLHITGISFRADNALIKQTDCYCGKLERAGVSRLRKSKYSPEKRVELARAFLKEHAVMRIMDYVELTGLSRTAATVELRNIARDPESGITFTGCRSSKVYVLDAR